ncbi:MAG: DUF1501 domain-containing protein [Planctomycetes bacterium]|nr:DUF1501 domain-containing protein [Planctomycetota bacterium]
MNRWRFNLEPVARCLTAQTRRTFLRAALAGVGGAAIARDGPAALLARRRPDTACIVFFLDGGPSHFETFDPKPNAPADIRGEFASIATSASGVRIGEHLPLLARQAHRYSLIRSLYHGNPSHAEAEHQMLTGWMGSRPGTARAVIEKPSLGSIVSRLRGPRRSGMPGYVAVPWSFHHAYRGSPFGAAAYLGPRHEPFESGHLPSSPAAPFRVTTLQLQEGVSGQRLRSRRELLEHSRASASSSAIREQRDLTDQGMELLLNDRLRDGFDLSREPRFLRDRYGTHEWGQGALLSRRLVDAGVTFIMLQCGLRQDWDTHRDNFAQMKRDLLPPLDRAVSALIEDLQARGMLEQTLVLVMGEFGRTPLVNRNAGRDHWASVFSVLVAGGGLKGGQVIGSSDRRGAYPREGALHAHDLFATMYHVLGIDPTTMFHDQQGRPIPVLPRGLPITELLA